MQRGPLRRWSRTSRPRRGVKRGRRRIWKEQPNAVECAGKFFRIIVGYLVKEEEESAESSVEMFGYGLEFACVSQ